MMKDQIDYLAISWVGLGNLAKKYDISQSQMQAIRQAVNEKKIRGRKHSKGYQVDESSLVENRQVFSSCQPDAISHLKQEIIMLAASLQEKSSKLQLLQMELETIQKKQVEIDESQDQVQDLVCTIRELSNINVRLSSEIEAANQSKEAIAKQAETVAKDNERICQESVIQQDEIAKLRKELDTLRESLKPIPMKAKRGLLNFFGWSFS